MDFRDDVNGTAERRSKPQASAPVVATHSPNLVILSKRADFLKAARSRQKATPGFILQGRERGGDGRIRVGFTCSKKVGNAVARNRAKRRLREIARAVIPANGRPGWDYVLIGRAEATATRTFDVMKSDLADALMGMHAD